MFKLAFVVQLFEQPPQVGVVWSLVKVQIPTVCHVSGHLLRIAKAQSIYWSIDFTLFYLVVFVIFVAGSKTLPWQFSFE